MRALTAIRIILDFYRPSSLAAAARFCVGRVMRCLVLVLAGLSVACGGAAHAKDEMKLEDFAMSPDGRVVAFQFYHRPNGPHGLGLYEWQTGKLRRIPNPPGKQMGVPSFSYDGKRLAIVIQDHLGDTVSDIAVVDLATMAITQVTHADRAFREKKLIRGKTNPAFQPGTNNILYVEGGIGVPRHLKLVNISDGTERVILDERHGFFEAIFRPYFVSAEEIYFSAIAPRDKELVKAVDALGVRNTSSTIAYRLPFGEKPEVLFPESEKSLKNVGYHEGLNSLTISQSGKYIIFITANNRETLGIYYDDLYRLNRDGKFIRLTNLNGHLAYARIAYDGSAVAFGSDPSRQKHFDLSILDLRNGQVTETDLLAKLIASPEFLSP